MKFTEFHTLLWNNNNNDFIYFKNKFGDNVSGYGFDGCKSRVRGLEVQLGTLELSGISHREIRQKPE